MFDLTPDPVAFSIGPLDVFWYGIAYAAGLVAVYALLVRLALRAGRRPELVGNGMIIVAVAALVGGRLYHVIDQWQLYRDDLLSIVLPPYSGLGVYGGLATGTLAAWLYTRYLKEPFWTWADIIAPGLFLMQAIGRWGNFFNQELYGPPTTLPWGIPIDCAHRVTPYLCETLPFETARFHPLFLYESLSGFLGMLALLYIGSRFRERLRPGDLVLIFFIWYGIVRFGLETLRVNNWTFAGIPTAMLVAGASVLVALAILVYRHRSGRQPDEPPAPVAGPADEPDPGPPISGPAPKSRMTTDGGPAPANGSSGPSPRRRPQAARVSPQALAAARGGVKEGLDWLGHPPHASAGLVFRLAVLVGRAMLFGVFRFRIESSGREQLPPGGYLLVCAVHRGWMDPFVVIHALPLQPRAWFLGSGPSAFSARWREWLVRRVGGMLPVWRGGVGVERHVASARAVLDAGAVFVLMPEGGVTGPPNRLAPFRVGAALIALRTGAPIVPLAIAGTAKLYLGKRMASRILPPTSAAALLAEHWDGTLPAEGSRAELELARHLTDRFADLLGPVVAELYPTTVDPPSRPRRLRGLTWLLLARARAQPKG